MTRPATNGGFPDPPVGEPVRVVRCAHLTCGHQTRVRLPGTLPAEAVRRVVCGGCGRTFESHLVEEIEAPRPGGVRPRHGWLDRRPGRGWRVASIPIAAVGVIAVLFAIRSLGGENAADRDGGTGSATPVPEGRVVDQPTYTLALPPGWRRTQGPSGSAFAAEALDGTAEATLFVDREPKLELAAFEARSLRHLRELAGSAEVADRIPGPTPEQTTVTLVGPVKGGAPAHEVTLRAAGPYRYFLSTTLAPDASGIGRRGARLIHNSFIPRAQ